MKESLQRLQGSDADMIRVLEDLIEVLLQRGVIRITDLPEAAVAMDNLLAYLNDNCVPSAYWAGGPGWGTYKLAIEPRKGEDRPQMPLMRKHLANDCTAIGPTPAHTAD